MNLCDPEMRETVERAADLVDMAQAARAAAEHLATENARLHGLVCQLHAALDSKAHEAAFLQSRLELAQRALARWQAYDRALKEKPSPGRSRRYCEALAATRSALADLAPMQAH